MYFTRRNVYKWLLMLFWGESGSVPLLCFCVFCYLFRMWRVSELTTVFTHLTAQFSRGNQDFFLLNAFTSLFGLFRLKGGSGIFQVLLNEPDECFLSNLTLKKTTGAIPTFPDATSAHRHRVSAQMKRQCNSMSWTFLRLSVYLLSGTFIWCESVCEEKFPLCRGHLHSLIYSFITCTKSRRESGVPKYRKTFIYGKRVLGPKLREYKTWFAREMERNLKSPIALFPFSVEKKALCIDRVIHELRQCGWLELIKCWQGEVVKTMPGRVRMIYEGTETQ